MLAEQETPGALPAAVNALVLPDDAASRAALRRMKRTATGLLAATGLVFLATFALPDNGFVGFVRAAAEAGMVGGVADWFAVTALFRHPLGLKVPHTALVPRKKDELATKLGEFVTGNFLTPDAVARQVAEARLVLRAGERLTDPGVADRLATEVATTLSAVLGSLDHDNLADSLLDLARRDVHSRSYSPLLGRLLAVLLEGRGHRPLVDVLARSARTYLVAHRDEIRPQIKGFLVRQGTLFRLFTTNARVDRLLDEAISALRAMEEDGEANPTRRSVDNLLASIADRLRADAPTIAAVDSRLRDLVDSEPLRGLVQSFVTGSLASVRESLADPTGDLHAQIARVVRDVGARVVSDASFAGRLEASLERAVRYVVMHYGDQAVRLIQRTVASWDARDASDRIEVAVGRDLQFIRINGTVVGALAGVLIHTVAVVLG